jgi:hypothetical protein
VIGAGGQEARSLSFSQRSFVVVGSFVAKTLFGDKTPMESSTAALRELADLSLSSGMTDSPPALSQSHFSRQKAIDFKSFRHLDLLSLSPRHTVFVAT